MSQDRVYQVIPLRPEHRAQWERLYAGYAAFYKVEQTPQMREIVWRWIFDAQNELEALVAVDESGRAAGLAHYRHLLRPLRAVVAGFLDDLFVDPEHRGSGVAQALMRGLAEVGRARGWATIRWLTAEDNYRARAFYDQISSRTVFLTYEMKI
ncbi:MAG: GNAT family N-acetyltransferase [Steroidobacteraceae bacterium]